MSELYVLGAPYILRLSEGYKRTVSLQPKLLALLTYLTRMTLRGLARRDTLAALFWPDKDERHARNALSQALFRLRGAIGRDAILSKGAEELSVSEPPLWCDASEFVEALRHDRDRDAIELYRGPLLEGLHVNRVPEFEHWLTTEREKLRLLACDALSRLAEKDESEGNLTGATRWLRRHLELAPDDELVLQKLMRTLDRAGDRGGAIHVYNRFSRRLAEDLSLQPLPQTDEILDQLLGSQERGATGGTKPSIAVLPFDNFSPEPEQEYLCHGLTEELITTLAQTKRLRVMARKSLSKYREEGVDIRELARHLGVSTVLEGSVRRSGDNLRVTAQLIDASGYHVWSEQYDRRFRDALAIQEDIARAITGALTAELLGVVPSTGESPATAPEQSKAHALYLKGVFHRHKRTPQEMAKARQCFEECVRQYPDYAQAHAALAFHHAATGHFHYELAPPYEAYDLAREAVNRAMALNDRIPEAHTAQGILRAYYEWDWVGAEKAFVRALELDPDDLYTLANYTVIGLRPGQSAKFVALSRRCEMLDPFWINAKTQVGVALLVARQYAEAEARLKEAEEIQPDWPISPLYLGDIHLLFDRPDRAESCYRRVMEIIGRKPMILGRFGVLEASRGRASAAREVLDELVAMRRSQYVRPSYLADIHFALEERDEAYGLMNQAIEERDTRLVTLASWPLYNRFRFEPRFESLLKTIGLSE